jgi:hypothetical protein
MSAGRRSRDELMRREALMHKERSMHKKRLMSKDGRTNEEEPTIKDELTTRPVTAETHHAQRESIGSQTPIPEKRVA